MEQEKNLKHLTFRNGGSNNYASLLDPGLSPLQLVPLEKIKLNQISFFLGATIKSLSSLKLVQVLHLVHNKFI